MATVLSDLIDEVQRLTNWVDPALRTRVRDAINRGIEHFAERVPIPALARYEAFAADGSKFMTFPERVRQIRTITDITNRWPVRAGEHWNRTHPTRWLESTSGGTPFEFRDLGWVPVISQPQTDTYISATATQSESMTLRITGLARDTSASGTALEFYEVNEDLAITSDAAATSTNIFVEVHRLEKSIDDGDADLKVTDAQAAKTIARLGARERASQYRRVEFLDAPGAGSQFRVEYYMRPDPLIDENVAILPGVDLDFVKWRAAGDVAAIKEDPQTAQLFWRKAEGILENFVLSEIAQGEKGLQLQPRWRYGLMERVRRGFWG